MTKKITVLPGCIACGLCTVSSYIEENPDGTVVPKGGVILQGKEVSAFQQLVEECPAKVLKLETLTSKTQQQIVIQMEQEAETFALPIPTRESVSFEREKIKIEAPIGGVYGEYCYDYSSYNRAKEAVKRAIDSAFYSQRKTAVQNVINRYQIDKLSPYYEYKETAHNFYYSANQIAQKKLDQWIQEILLCKPEVEIPESLLKIQTRPDSTLRYYLSYIKTDILSSAGNILAGLSDSLYSLSSYVDYCDIDSEEFYAGEGIFGRTKYVTKYCFRNTAEAIREMKKDLELECQLFFDEKIVTPAYSMINILVEQYSKNLKEELKGKAKELKKKLQEKGLPEKKGDKGNKNQISRNSVPDKMQENTYEQSEAFSVLIPESGQEDTLKNLSVELPGILDGGLNIKALPVDEKWDFAKWINLEKIFVNRQYIIADLNTETKERFMIYDYRINKGISIDELFPESYILGIAVNKNKFFVALCKHNLEHSIQDFQLRCIDLESLKPPSEINFRANHVIHMVSSSVQLEVDDKYIAVLCKKQQEGTCFDLSERRIKTYEIHYFSLEDGNEIEKQDMETEEIAVFLKKFKITKSCAVFKNDSDAKDLLTQTIPTEIKIKGMNKWIKGAHVISRYAFKGYHYYIFANDSMQRIILEYNKNLEHTINIERTKYCIFKSSGNLKLYPNEEEGRLYIVGKKDIYCVEYEDSKINSIGEGEEKNSLEEIISSYEMQVNNCKGSEGNLGELSADRQEKELSAKIDDCVQNSKMDIDKPFLMSIEDIIHSTRGIVAIGKIERGNVSLYDEVELVGFSEVSCNVVIKGIEHKLRNKIYPENNIGVLLGAVQETEIKKGQCLCKPGTMKGCSKFVAQVNVLTENECGQQITIFNQHQSQFRFKAIDVTGICYLSKGTDKCTSGESIEMLIELICPVPMEKEMSFSICENSTVVGIGKVKALYQMRKFAIDR